MTYLADPASTATGATLFLPTGEILYLDAGAARANVAWWALSGKTAMSAAGQGAAPGHDAPTARRPDFGAVNRAAMAVLPALVARWLPGGRRIGQEWVCGSLRGERGDSCKINIRTGKWADFATGERGGDPVSLAAAVHGLRQAEAARKVAAMLGLKGARHG